MSALLPNVSEGDPLTDVMWNEIINIINGLKGADGGYALFVASGSWTVPEGITTSTRIRIHYVGGGGGGALVTESEDIVFYAGGPSRWGYKITSGYSEGQVVPIIIGAAGAGSPSPSNGGPTNIDSGAMVSAGGLNGTILAGTPGSVPAAPSGATVESGPYLAPYGQAENGGAVIIEW